MCFLVSVVFVFVVPTAVVGLGSYEACGCGSRRVLYLFVVCVFECLRARHARLGVDDGMNMENAWRSQPADGARRILVYLSFLGEFGAAERIKTKQLV